MQNSTKFRLNTAVVILIGAGVLLYVGLRIVFPKYSYFSDEADAYKIQVQKEQLGSGNYFTVTPLHDYPYHKIEVVLESKEKFEQVPTEIKMHKNFIAQFYPIGETLTTPEQIKQYLFFNNEAKLPNGTLAQDDNVVYFISKGQRHPFLGPEVFLRLGFDWDEVTGKDSKFVASIPEGERINFPSAHLDGTILETKQGELFLVWEKTLLPIQSKELLSNVWDSYHTVRIDQAGSALDGACKFVNESGKKIKCSFEPPVEIVGAVGHSYLFELPRNVYDSVSDARITLKVLGRYELRIVRDSLKRIKDRLYLKYAEHILIL